MTNEHASRTRRTGGTERPDDGDPPSAEREMVPDGGAQTENETVAEEPEADDADESETEASESSGGDDDLVKELSSLTEEDVEGSFGVLDARQTAESVADEVIGGPLDGVTEVRPVETGWMVIVEIIERRAVPDTQDIIGRYELELDDDGTVLGYKQVDRYRRGDTTHRD